MKRKKLNNLSFLIMPWRFSYVRNCKRMIEILFQTKIAEDTGYTFFDTSVTHPSIYSTNLIDIE